MHRITIEIPDDAVFDAIMMDAAAEVLEETGEAELFKNTSTYIIGAIFMGLNENRSSISLDNDADGKLEYAFGGV